MFDSVAAETGINPEAAKREVLRREAARRFLIPYCEYTSPWYRTAPFHKLIAKDLEDVEYYIAHKGQPSRDGRTGIDRLMVLVPPQYGKTTLVSQLFPSWFLGKNPDAHVILTSYGASLASGNSAKVRDMVSSKEFANVFGEMSSVDLPVDLSIDQQQKADWALAAPHRGGLAAAGVGGALTGKPGHLLIIDDPFKNREEAESPTYQEKVWDWYWSVVYQRRQPYSAIVFINTRWDPKDLSGRLMMEMVINPKADKWVIRSLPAMAPEPEEYARDTEDQRRNYALGVHLNLVDPLGRKPGEVLWPQHFTPEEVQRTKDNSPTHDWLALHMQTPRSRTGGFFDIRKFETWPMERVPKDLLWFRLWDLAVSPKKTADSTAGGAIAMDADGNLFIRDMRHWKLSWPNSRREMVKISQEIAAAKTWTEIWGIEQVAFQLAAVQEFLVDPLMADRAVYAVVPEGDKVSMAYPLQNRLDMGKVILVDGPWVRGFLDVAALFPRPEAEDDEIDTITKGMQLMRWWNANHAAQEEDLFVYDERVRISPV